MWRQLAQGLALVLFDRTRRVHVLDFSVGIYRQQDIGHVCLKIKDIVNLFVRRRIITNFAEFRLSSMLQLNKAPGIATSSDSVGRRHQWHATRRCRCKDLYF